MYIITVSKFYIILRDRFCKLQTQFCLIFRDFHILPYHNASNSSMPNKREQQSHKLLYIQ